MQASDQDIAAFKSVTKGKNFVTDEVLRFEKVGSFVIEVSRGHIFGSYLYGMTVIERGPCSVIQRPDLSESFTEIEEIDQKIKSLETYYDDFLQNFESKYVE